MEEKIEKFKKLVVEGDFATIRETYPSKLMDKAYAYVGKKCENWEKVVKEKYQGKKYKEKKEKKEKRPKCEITQEFSRKRIRITTGDDDDSSEENEQLNIKKSVVLEDVLKKNKDHIKAIEGGKKRVKNEDKKEKKKEAKEEKVDYTKININDPTNPDCIVPRKVVPITNKYEVKENQNYFLIPKAYNLFLTSYETVFSLFQTVRESSEEILKDEKPINIKVEKIENIPDIHKDLYKIKCENRDIEIYYIDYLSADFTLSPHLIPEKLYNDSMEYISKLFPHFYGDLVSKPCDISTNIKGYFPVSDSECEIYEGRIYHIEGNCLEQPFESVRVVWYDQHKITGKWILSFFQLDNILSPWDIEISEEADRYKSLISIEHLPHNPTNTLTITQTLMNPKYGPEGNVIFKSLINSEDCPRYYEVIKHPLSFTEVLRKAEGNLYNSDNMDEYWKDLELIISNAKTFNQKERFEWRCADILECCVERFKWEYQAIDHSLNNEKEKENKNVDFEDIATQREIGININDKEDNEESDTDQEETQKGKMEEEEESEDDEKDKNFEVEEEDISDESQ